MSAVKFVYDTREKAIKDSIIAEFSNPHVFAATKGTIIIEERQLPVADYVITLDGKIVAIIERKTLKDYASSFKDGRHANKAKLLNVRTKTNCNIYYVVEGPTNPDYQTEYAGIKYQNILASTNDLMIRDNIHVIRTVDANHTCRSLKMLCESYLRVVEKDRKENKNKIIKSVEFVGDDHNEVDAPKLQPSEVDAQECRAEIAFEEVLTKANFTPEEKLKMSRVKAWATIKGVGEPTAAIIANQFRLSDWILGSLNTESVNNFTFNGRRNNKLIAALSLRPNLEMQIKLLTEMRGFSANSARELLVQYSLEDLLMDRDYSHVRRGKNTKLTPEKIEKIKEYLSNLN